MPGLAVRLFGLVIAGSAADAVDALGDSFKVTRIATSAMEARDIPAVGVVVACVINDKPGRDGPVGRFVGEPVSSNEARSIMELPVS